jgi:hypothetical protein
MTKIIITLIITFVLCIDIPACSVVSLQGAFRNNHTILIAKIKREVNSNGKFILYLKDIKSLNGKLIQIDSIQIRSPISFSKYDAIIFSPINPCNNELNLSFDMADVWIVKKGIIHGAVYWGGGKIPLKELKIKIKDWLKMGTCTKC